MQACRALRALALASLALCGEEVPPASLLTRCAPDWKGAPSAPRAHLETRWWSRQPAWTPPAIPQQRAWKENGKMLAGSKTTVYARAVLSLPSNAMRHRDHQPQNALLKLATSGAAAARQAYARHSTASQAHSATALAQRAPAPSSASPSRFPCSSPLLFPPHH